MNYFTGQTSNFKKM